MLTGTNTGLLTLQLAAWSSTTRAIYTIWDDRFQLMLNNFAYLDASLAAALNVNAQQNTVISALQGQLSTVQQQLSAALSTNDLQSQQIASLSASLNSVLARVSTLESSGGGNGGTNGSEVTVSISVSNVDNVTRTATFTGNASTTVGSIVAHEWSFGDGLTGTGQSVNHQYASLGTYTVTLLARNSSGVSTSTQAQVTFEQFDFQFPLMNFAANTSGTPTQTGWVQTAFPQELIYIPPDSNEGPYGQPILIPARYKRLQLAVPVPSYIGKTITAMQIHVAGDANATSLKVNQSGTTLPQAARLGQVWVFTANPGTVVNGYYYFELLLDDTTSDAFNVIGALLHVTWS